MKIECSQAVRELWEAVHAVVAGQYSISLPPHLRDHMRDLLSKYQGVSCGKDS